MLEPEQVEEHSPGFQMGRSSARKCVVAWTWQGGVLRL